VAGLSRLLVPTLLRPIGEHLLAMVRPQPGDLCVDVGGACGVMPLLLARQAREVVVVADSPDALGELRDETDVLHVDNVVPVLQRSDALSMPDGIVQVVTSLFAPLTAETLAELRRVLDPHRGRIAWAVSVQLPGVRIGGDPPSGVDTVRVHDVARFDGVAHYQAATGARGASDALLPFTAPDGTIRIPIEAEVVGNR
jgi:hypothetical protein